METLEKGLQNIDQHTKDAIKKHNDILTKTLFDTAQKSNQSSEKLDLNSKKVFPEASSFGKVNEEPFNPNMVVEFREGKSYQVIKDWNKIKGILPNRKVMGTYFLDKIQFEVSELHTKGNIFRGDGHIHNVYCSNHKVIRNANDQNNGRFGTNCGCGGMKITSQQFFPIPDLPLHRRGENRKYVQIENTFTFEVDNYLNLYHPDSGLYLMFNKTTFPSLTFYLAEQYTKLDDKDYYKIYLSKRLENINFRFDINYYNSIDQRDDFLKNINELVPDTYHKVYELFNKFRKFESFSIEDNEQLVVEAIIEDTTQTDKKDRIIQGLQLKLNEIILRTEKAEKIISEMIEDYNKQSNDKQTLDREKNLLELKLIETENNFKLEKEKIQKQCSEKINEEIEKYKQENFGLYKRLAEAEVFAAKAESIGLTMATIQKKLEKQELEVKRYKDMNKSLVQQVKQEKENNKKISGDNTELINQIKNNQINLESSKELNEELTKNLKEKNTECDKLSKNLSQIGEQSSNALENALSDQIEDLEEQINKLKEEKNELRSEKIKLERDFNNIKQVLSNLNL